MDLLSPFGYGDFLKDANRASSASVADKRRFSAEIVSGKDKCARAGLDIGPNFGDTVTRQTAAAACGASAPFLGGGPRSPAFGGGHGAAACDRKLQTFGGGLRSPAGSGGLSSSSCGNRWVPASGGGLRSPASCGGLRSPAIHAGEYDAPETLRATNAVAFDMPIEELRRIAITLRLLSLCGGPDRPDGIDKVVREFGAAIDVYDLEISADHNLVNDTVWRQIKADYEDAKYDSGGAAAPCSTFSASRRWNDGGPPPLRGEHAPDIYGLKNLDVESKEAVRVGTCVAVRCFEMTRWMVENGRPCWYETPARKSGHPSVFKLSEVIETENIDGVCIMKVVQ